MLAFALPAFICVYLDSQQSPSPPTYVIIFNLIWSNPLWLNPHSPIGYCIYTCSLIGPGVFSSFLSAQIICGSQPSLYSMVTVDITPLVKEPGPECDYVPPYKTKVKNKSFCTFTSPCAYVACIGTVLLHTFVFIRNVDLREAHISGLYVEFIKLVHILTHSLP